NIKFSSEFNISDNDPVLNRIRPNASVISTLAQFNDPIATAIYRNLNAVMSNVSAFGKDDTPEEYATSYYNKNNEALEELNKQIKKFDFGIQNIKLLKTENGIRPTFDHKGLDVDIGYDFESQGTQSFYSLFPYIYFVLQSGGIAVLDELGGDFHPLLLPEIVKAFQHRETNPYDAQLIMTCLNATLFESLEKEEIFFTEKTESGETQIYGAKNITGVRRDTNIYAKYLLGALGGIPVVG
ncbi:MAG TPA: ATP-binding protein, partial [Ignavibacteria bacterium]|nr:ATP-binding protein [Ignavibacteria bacterium]